jgi:hypothetical protein
MIVTSVESTTLATVIYDAECELLRLEFRDRLVYDYFAFPPRPSITAGHIQRGVTSIE